MPSESQSEDPATNLAMNVQQVIDRAAAHDAARSAPPTQKPSLHPGYFDTTDTAAIKKALTEVAPRSTIEEQVKAVQAALQKAASQTPTSANATPDATERLQQPLTLTASAPNVLGGKSRRLLVRSAVVVAIIAVGTALVVFFSGKNPGQLPIALVGLSFTCIVVAYLTTMGFGSVKFNYGDDKSAKQDT